MTFNRVHVVVSVHVHAKYHQAQCSGSWVIVLTNFFALSCNDKESENPALWPWPLTYDLEILWVSCGCQGTCWCKISSSWVQRFMSYRANRQKNSDENNTTRTVIRVVHFGWWKPRECQIMHVRNSIINRRAIDSLTDADWRSLRMSGKQPNKHPKCRCHSDCNHFSVKVAAVQ